MTDMKKYTVYIFKEENKDLLNNIKESIIKTNNFTVIGTSDNATNCLNYLSTNNCDLLIIDLMLTNIDGIGVLNKLKTINSHAYNKVVCITSFTNPLICENLEKLNVNYCFKQPFDINYFTNTLNSIMKVSLEDMKDMNQNESEKYKKIKLENEITEILHEVGIPAHIKGYMYLRTAILSTYYNIELLAKLLKYFILILLDNIVQLLQELKEQFVMQSKLHGIVETQTLLMIFLVIQLVLLSQNQLIQNLLL